MRMVGRLGQDLLDDAFRQLSRTLILLLDDAHFHAGTNLGSGLTIHVLWYLVKTIQIDPRFVDKNREDRMSDQNNADVVRQAYNNFKTGNINALLNLLADDVDWRLPAIKNVPFAKRFQGRAGVGQFFAGVGENQEVIRFEPKEFISEGDKVAVIGHYEWRVKSTGKNFEGDWVHVFTVRNGKVTAFLEFTDTAAAAAAYEK